ncbi:MAG: hypothetical protein IPK82_04485 [Polyangiaceae bacterium]|nr:hypothetical protein [Polyangiaceae bacterium]
MRSFKLFSSLRSISKPALLAVLLSAFVACDSGGETLTEDPVATKNPILFVTQTPFHSTFDMITATFGNHMGGPNQVPRGGDLMIAYPDGSLRNLTEEAGFGVKSGEEIAVREPCVHWSGTRAIFSMVIGGTVKNELDPKFWQIYEITGLGKDESASIKRVENQPEGFNNVSPVYASDGRIIFTTDRPRSGKMLHYPQLDEYESVQTNTGLWSFDPSVSGGDLKILTHVPSGAFSPKVALDGRVVYVRWDHLQIDQQAHADITEGAGYGSFDYVSEDSEEKAASMHEPFPEPWLNGGEAPAPYHRHQFNQFFPWQINQDGTDEETVNHVGRHEFIGFIDSSRDDLPYQGASEEHPPFVNFFHIMEDPANPGRFYGTNSPEFGTHSSGEIVAFDGQLEVNAADMYPIHVTGPVSYDAPEASGSEAEGAHGRYRNPLPLSDGTLVAVHTPDTRQETGEGEGPFGNKTYKFRIRHLEKEEGSNYMVAGAPITKGISKKFTYFDNQSFTDVSYDGPMWELDPVEVIVRPTPFARTAAVPDIERAIIDETLASSGGYEALVQYLKDNNYALLISRDVTRRADEQQPFNLSIPGGVSTIREGADIIDEIQFIQFFQADQVRAYTNHREGRRPIPREMHDAPDGGETLKGAYRLGADGSFAALVPAGRALSWQLSSPDGAPVVRERYWVTSQPGEIRVCPNCHGVNETDVVMNQPSPQNPPQALAPLLQSIFN